MNTDKHRFLSPVLFSSVFICVHLWLNSACFGQSYDKRWLSGIFYGEGANFGDFNKDGKLDVVSGPFIYEGPEFTMKREFMPPQASDPLHYSQNFFAYTADHLFADIWNRSPVFQQLRNPKALEGKCGDCRYEALCGGCRARAYAATGSFLAEEPFCSYRPDLDVPRFSSLVPRIPPASGHEMRATSNDPPVGGVS